MSYGNLLNDTSQRRALEALLAGENELPVGWAGPGSVPRLVAEKLAETVSAKDFGAVGDGATDDTVALQAFFDEITLGSTRGHLPPGNYKITSPILIGNSTVATGTSQWHITGYGATITQYTANTPVIKFNKENNRRFGLGGMTLTWNAQAADEDTSANAIFITADSGNNYGTYECHFFDIAFGQGYGGIVNDLNGSFTIPVWQCYIDRCFGSQFAKGPLVDIRQNSSGQPGVYIRQCYVRSDARIAAPIILSGIATGEISGLKIVKPIRTVLVSIETSFNVRINNMRVEQATLTATGTKDRGLITASGANVDVNGLEIQSCTFGETSGAYYAVRGISSSDIRARNIYSRSQTFQNGASLFGALTDSTSLIKLESKIFGTGISDVVGGSGSDLRLIRADGSRLFSVSNNAAVSITPANGQTIGRANVTVSGQAAYSGEVIFDTGGTPQCTSVYSGANFGVSTSVLTGSTGSANNLTISANGGLIYIENRTGASRGVRLAIS